MSETASFPSTRFQGSKRKLTEWIISCISSLDFDTVLDVFGGTGAVSYIFKQAGKLVTYNDNLAFNYNIGLALIENRSEILSSEEIDTILTRHLNVEYQDFIEKTFKDIYFNDDENRWLDQTIHNIDHLLNNPYKVALARFALYQSAIIKRPYNLFHRANLYMRNASVTRSFGNKATWDTGFEKHFKIFAEEANQSVFDNHRDNMSINLDAFETPIGSDLVYIDSPYLNEKGVGVDYRGYYHFLEGMTCYDKWPDMIDYKSKHRRLIPVFSEWNKANAILAAFDALCERHKHSKIVISYRDNGIPSVVQLIDVLKGYKKNVRIETFHKQYALSKTKSNEILLIGT